VRYDLGMSKGIVLVLCALTACALPRAAVAADPAQILKEAATAIAAQKTISIGATIEYRGKFQGSEEELDTTYALALERGGNFSVHVENPDTEISIYRSDAEYTRYMPAFNQYIVEATDKTPEEIVIASGFELIDPAMRALATVVSPAPFTGAFVPESLSYVGAEPQGGHPCDHIRFVAAGYTYDLWIDAAPSRLIRRIEADMTPLEEKFGAQYGTVFDFSVAAVIDRWEADTDLSSALRFAAPEGAEKVAQFMPPRPVSEAEKMAGSPAPDFTLPLLSGGEMTLSKEKGHTVILDFWATWCGPCRVAMPAIHLVAKEFAGKGVKLYSINGGEEAEQIKAFLVQMGLEDIPVALDTDMSISNLYKAEGIPQTVIISPDGVIRIVHVGLWAMPTGEPAATAEEQEKEIQAVLAKALREQLTAVIEVAATTAAQ